MVEFQRTQERELTTVSPVKICVVGVGGGGLNVLDRISLDRLMEASLVTMHTDVRVLSHSMTPVKIQLGVEIMRGIGSGGDPELGRDAALASKEQIQAALKGHDLVFICAGLGGGDRFRCSACSGGYRQRTGCHDLCLCDHALFV